MPAVCRINREQGFDSGRITSPSDHPSARRSAIVILGFFTDEYTSDLLKLIKITAVQTLQCLLVPETRTIRLVLFLSVSNNPKLRIRPIKHDRVNLFTMWLVW
jgi:hypothetical protein